MLVAGIFVLAFGPPKAELITPVVATVTEDTYFPLMLLAAAKPTDALPPVLVSVPLLL